MPSCSVVIPWHRNLDDLRAAAESVFAQSVQDFEIVVVANGVDDVLYDAARGLFGDARWRVVRIETPGASIARNHGLLIAEGGLVFFLDADDTFYPQKLEKFIDAHRATGFDLAFSRGSRERGNGVSWSFPARVWDGKQPLADYFFRDGCLISGTALVVSASVRDRLGFDESCHFCEDPDLVVRAGDLGLKVVMLPDTLFRWNDERSEGRLSRRPDFQARLDWARRREGVYPPEALAAFRARCVAQHDFPRNFARNLSIFAEAAALKAVTPRETALFMLRGLLPEGVKQSLLNRYLSRRSQA